MKAIKRVPIATQVVESIRQSIVKGQFHVGEKLPPEVKLCEILQVSRSSIREALRHLQAEGYVELLPGRGAFVRDNQSYDYNAVRRWFIASSPNVRDFCEVRGVMEPLAARMAVERGTVEEYKTLQDIHDDFVDAAKENNVSELASLDEKFHTQIAAMSHNSLLSNINDILNSELKEYRIRSISVKANSKNTVKEHKQILMGIKKKDSSAASAAMLFHLDMVLSDIRKVLDGPIDDNSGDSKKK